MTTVHDEPRSRRLPGTGAPSEPWKQWGLALITLGIYAAVHHYRINRDLRDFGLDVDPTKAALAFFPGCLLVIPYLLTAYWTGRRIGVAQETVDLVPTVRPEVSCAASLFGFLQVPYHQAQVNRVWATQIEGTQP